MNGAGAFDPRPVVAASVRGEAAAFALLISTHHAEMRRLAVVVLRDQAAADRAVRDAWVTAWARLPRLKDALRLRPWLLGLTIGASGVARDGSSTGSTAGAGFAPGTPIGSLPLRVALEGLAPRERALLGLRYLHHLSFGDIAFALGEKERSIERQVGELMQRLRRVRAGG